MCCVKNISSRVIIIKSMAHRIAKKHYKARVQTNDTPSQQTSYQQTVQSRPRNDQKIPRPIIPSSDEIYLHDKSSYKKGKFAFPPAQSLFVSENIYDAGPDFIRPTSAVMLGNPKKTQFPFGAWITPFGSEKVSTIRAKGPLRCARCKAYANAYFRFDGTKSSAICNICGISFQIDNQNVDPANLNSSELQTEGIIDFVVSDKRFMRKRLDIIKIVLAFEIGTFMSESGAFNTIIDSIKAAIENNQFEANIRIGVVYFNGEGVTYLKLKNNEKWSQFLPRKYQVKYSASGLCNPLSDKEMFLDPAGEKQKILYMLDSINIIAEEFYRNSKYATYGANYGATLKSLLNNFEAETGRVMLFSNCTPRTGPLGIRGRNAEDAKTPYKPLSPDYYDLSRKYLESKVGIDMFLLSKQPLLPQQIPTVHYLCSITGGALRFYSPFNADNHGENLYYEIYGCMTRKYVYDVDFTARVSNGLNIASFGAFDSVRQSRDVTLSMMDPNSSVMFTFEHEEKIQENSSAFLQYAMMFTNGSGERRLRIINYRYFITNKISVLHEASDYLAVSNILMRQAISRLLKGDANRARQQVINRLSAIICQYAQEAGTISRGSVFMAHPNFAPALAYIHSIVNSRLFLNFTKSSPDYIVYEALRANRLNFYQYANYFYPKLYSLGLQIYESQVVPGELIEGDYQIQQSAVLPPNLPLTHESLAKDGVFMNVSCDYILILVMPEAPEELLYDIFGTCNWDEIEQNGIVQLQESAHNARINIMIEQIRRRNSSKNGIYLPILVRTPKKKAPFNELISFVTKEDVIELKYFAFLDVIHRQVQTRAK